MLSRLRAEDGFGIIELTVAIVMLNVGILAIVAAFNSGAVSLARASKLANANVIADTQLETYRRKRNCQIYLTASSIPTAASSTYKNDTAAYSDAGGYYGSSQQWAVDTNGTSWATTYSPAIAPNGATTASGLYDPNNAGFVKNASQCAGNGVTAEQTVTGPDKRSYLLDTYIYLTQVQVSAGVTTWQTKVTVAVRDPSQNNRSLVRESSTYDPYDAP